MAKVIYQILGQVNPAASTETTLYTVPQKRSSIIKITGFNDDAGAAIINIAIVRDGGAGVTPATAFKDYILGGTNGYSVPAGSPIDINIDTLKGITLDELDQIRVESDKTNTTFHCYGVETEP